VALFAANGSYTDPASGGQLCGQAIAGYAAGLWSSFPDLSFQIVSVSATSDDRVAAQWIMRGTNRGPVRGMPPTGKQVELPGADFIDIAHGTIRSVIGYFDTTSFAAQLGLQTTVQPRKAGPFSFGTAVSVRTGKPTRPGAFSITAIYPDSDEQVEYVRTASREIACDMLEMPGFIGWSGLNFEEIMMTVTAWESPADVRAFMRNPRHRAAVQEHYNAPGAAGTMTSVWVPEHISATVRCPACGRMANYDRADGVCTCGARLPDPLPYW
jgi:steroid delta-isomerase-like uncharacterized protein